MPGDPSPPVKRMVFLIVVATIFAGYGTAYLASDDVRFVTRAGLEEISILQNREPIAELVADRTTDPAVRHALRLVLQSRDYAASLGLEAKETYTSYSDVGRDTLLLVLQAAPKDCICPYTWKYPIVGRIPYKGFFDFAAARREADRLEARGIRRVSPPLGGLLHPRMVQRPAPVHRAYPRLGGAGGDRVSTRSRTTRCT